MLRPSAPSLLPFAVAATLFAGRTARADDAANEAPSTERYVVRAELGPELDSNAHRTEQVKAAGVTNVAPVVSPLARAVLSGSLQDVVADGHQVAVSATLAGKLFEKPEARSEDVAIAEMTAAWRAALGDRSAFSLATAYYEAFQRAVFQPDYVSDRRDFRSLTTSLRLSRLLTDHTDGGLGAGYRLFVFKPDRSYDFQAPSASVDVRWAQETSDGAADWELAARASYERRAFAGKAIMGANPSSDGTPRVDHFATAALDAARTGGFLFGLGYALHVNRSNSFGETVTRHFLTSRFAVELPLAISLATRVEILIALYSDPIVVAQQIDTAGRTFVSIEDENRSNARIDLSRNLTDRLQLLARYTLYTNELAATSVTYRRQTALLSLSFTLEK